MFGLPIGLLLRIGLIVGLAGALLWGKHTYDEARRNEGRAEIKAQWDRDIARRTADLAQITQLWSEQRQRAEAATNERDKLRAERFAAIAAANRNLPPSVADIRIPAAAVSLFNSAVGAANAAPSGPTDKPAAPAAAPSSSTDTGNTPRGATNLGVLVGWATDAAASFAECRDQVIGWQRFYSSLQTAQTEHQL